MTRHRHLFRLTVAAITLLAFVGLSACRQTTIDKQKVTFSQSGWLVSKIRDGKWRVSAADDGQHAWAWEVGKKGVWLLDASGHTLNAQAPLLPDIEPSWGIFPAGDKRRGLVIVGNGSTSAPSNAYLVGLTAGDPPPELLLPIVYYEIRIFPTSEGAWIHAKKREHSQEKGTVSLKNDYYFLPNGHAKLNGPWNVEFLGNPDERVVGSTLVTSGITDGGENLHCYLIDPRAGAIPIRLALGSALQAAGRDGRTKIIPTPDGKRFWLRSGLTSVYLVDIQMALASASSKASYLPLEVHPPLQMTMRTLDATRAIGFPTPHWGGRKDSLPSSRGASLLDGGTNSITPIQNLQDALVDNIIVLGTDGILAQLGVDLDDQHLIYLPADGPLREVGKTNELGVDLAPWSDPHENGDVEVFPDQNDHSFVVRARDFAFHFEVANKDRLTLLASHDEKDVNRFVAPTVVPDANGHLWLISYMDDAAGRGIFVWDRIQGQPLNLNQPLFRRQLDLPEVVPLGDGQHAFANGRRGGLYLIDMKASVPGPAVQLGGTTLTGDSVPDIPISFSPNSDSGHVKFNPKGIEGLLDDQATIQVDITEDGSGHQRKWGTPSLTTRQETYTLAQALAGQDSDPKAHIEYGRMASIRVTLSDPLGTNASWTWTGAVFANPEPLFARPWFRAVLVFFAICFVALVTKRLAGGPQTFTRYILYIGSISAPWVGKDFLDPGVLAGLLGLSLLAG